MCNCAKVAAVPTTAEGVFEFDLLHLLCARLLIM